MRQFIYQHSTHLTSASASSLNYPEKPNYIATHIDKIYDESAKDLEPQHVALVLATLATGARLDFDVNKCKTSVRSDTSGLDSTSSRLSLELYRNAKIALAGAPVQSNPDYCTLLAVVRISFNLWFCSRMLMSLTVCFDLVSGPSHGL